MENKRKVKWASITVLVIAAVLQLVVLVGGAVLITNGFDEPGSIEQMEFNYE